MTKLNRTALTKIFALLTLLLCGALFFACNKNNPDPLLSSPCYELDIDYGDGVLTVYQEVLYYSPADTDYIVFNVYANAFDKNNNAIDILSAQINRKNVDFEIYGEDKTLLKVFYSARKAQCLNISFDYTVALQKADARLGLTTKDVANVSCFYPVVARYENGYREDCYNAFGDPFYHDISSFYVSITLDSGLSVASSGRITDSRPAEKINGVEMTTLEIEAENIRDFAMTIGGSHSITEKLTLGEKEVDVNYFYVHDPYPYMSLNRIKKSLAVFSEAFGAYPYDSFTVSQTNLDDAGGMEFGTFVIVSDISDREEYLDTITHETAHQWWYNVVGSDQINSAWLDEGLTEFCTYYFHYLTGNRARFNEAMASVERAYSAFSAYKPTLGFDGSMNRPLTSYLTDGEYVAVSYYKGAMLFNTLRELVGESKFKSAMQRYFEDNKFAIADADALINAFRSQGYEIDGIVKSWIDDSVKA